MTESSESNTSRLRKTLSYFGAFIGVGFIVGSLGPTLPGLADLTGASLGSLSSIFITQSGGYLAGALIGGRAFDKVPGNPILAGALVLAAIGMALVPLSPSVAVLTLVLTVIGFACGTLDAGGHALLVWLFPIGLDPWMNALHFCFGIGAFLSPQIIARTIGEDGSVSVTYWTIALLLLPFAIAVGVQSSPRIASHAADVQANLRPFTLTIILVGGLLFAAVGAEIGYGSWIYTYAVKSGIEDTVGAAQLTSAYWGSFTIGRLLGIPLATRMTPTSILGLCSVGIGIAALAALSGPDTPWIIWGATLLAGWAVAPMFAAVVNLAGNHMPISGRAMGWFFVGSSTGAMAVPWIIGQLFGSLGPEWTFYVILVNVFVGLGVLIIFNRHARTRSTLQASDTPTYEVQPGHN